MRRTAAGVREGNAVQSGSVLSTPARMSDTVSPPKRLRPTSISYSSTPKDQTSVRRSTGLPRACSGLM
jgi:hypothetical protein